MLYQHIKAWVKAGMLPLVKQDIVEALLKIRG